jgi:dTDP-4-amino-4,6-dideoxygalactose transaminase
MASRLRHREVPFLDLSKISKEEQRRVQRAVRPLLRSGSFILGDRVREFETLWARHVGSEHAIGVGNGMDAITIALMAAELPHRSEVITSPLTAVATVLGIIRAGHEPILADVDPRTGLLDIESVTASISARTRAILLVHLYGQVRNMEDWTALSRHSGISLFEDCAQSHLASEGGKVSGSFGLASAFSFYPTKNLGAYGDAGLIATDSDRISALSREIRNYGQSSLYVHDRLGVNSRMDEIQAVILKQKLEYLRANTLRRQEIARRYFGNITNSNVTLLEAPTEPSAHVYHLFVIRSKNREALRNHLAASGIGTIVHYPTPVHRQKGFNNLILPQNGLLAAEKMSQEIISIPCNPYMTDRDVDRVIESINSWRP